MARPMTLLLLASALLAVLFLVTEASIYRTTTTTTEVSQGGGGSMPEQCSREIMQVNLRDCENYIRQVSQSLGSSSSSSSGSVMMVVNQREQVPPKCCNQLKLMSAQCRCPAAFQAADQAMGTSYSRETYSERGYRIAGELPMRCNLEPQYCRQDFTIDLLPTKHP
ncbi:hypothetical protein Scep_028717 [Stephania cephalantha]|uniref:Bifunctional inhibitor/plant lipid transfer protein/seed storage helical domain-containing protein n=1 Tax=Stephania cephalantha TaxID=152367 RepID=A0AAP0EAH6_9MAGN